MRVLCVNYDLCHEDGHTYDLLIEALRKLATRCHALGSCWLIATQLSAHEVWERMKPCLHQNDKIFIVQVEKDTDWLTWNMPEASTFLKKWIKGNPPKTPAAPTKPSGLKAALRPPTLRLKPRTK